MITWVCAQVPYGMAHTHLLVIYYGYGWVLPLAWALPGGSSVGGANDWREGGA